MKGRLVLFLIGLLIFCGQAVSAETPSPDIDRDPSIHPQTPQTESIVNTRAPSAIFSVTSTLNVQDTNPGDGICDAFVGGGITCTLFAAIQEANATSAHDTIQFNISGAGPHVFNVASGDDLGLPEITQDITIDGTSQSGASCPNILDPADLRIVIDGGGSQAYGLRLGESADDSLIKGLVITNFTTAGIQMNGADRVNIECNHIGVGADGITPGSNNNGIRFSGDFSNSDDTIIGGTSSNSRSERNVISGNSRAGIYNNQYSDGSGSNGTIIRGNYIGTNATGSAAVPNGHGIWTRTRDGEIGGTQSYQANVISGNNSAAIRIGILAEDILIDGNYIGTGPLGIFAIPNPNGIRIDPNDAAGGEAAPTSITIGLLAPNRIAYNSENGIFVQADSDGGGEVTQAQWRTNEIFSNGQIGIDLGNNGVDTNDIDDPDTGPNGYQNWPVLISAEPNGRIRGNLFLQSIIPSQTYALDVYQSSDCDPSGNGEGAAYIDTIFITGAGGQANFDEFINPPPEAGKFLTMIATNGNGESSEFGNCIEVINEPFVVDSTTNLNDATPGDGICRTTQGFCTINAAVDEANALDNPETITIEFDLPNQVNSIFLVDPLTITRKVIIDGSSNPGASCPTENDPAVIRVQLVGQAFPENMITLAAGSDGSEIRGLAIVSSQSDGIRINSGNNIIACNHIGVQADGVTAAANADDGVQIAGGDNNTIGGAADSDRNVMSGNSGSGVQLSNNAMDNLIYGNYIGTNASGTAAVANDNGVFLLADATGTRIGASGVGHRNVIAGNTNDGILVTDGSNNTQVDNNYIGLDKDGLGTIANGRSGVRVDGSTGTLIGSIANYITGNGAYGVHVRNGANNTEVRNNFIGLTEDASRTVVSNGSAGVYVENSTSAEIGSATTGNPGYRNEIANNGSHGILLNGADDAVIRNNLIHDNNSTGIRVENSDDVEIGGFNLAMRNYIYGNGTTGVYALTNVNNLEVWGNYIGRTENNAASGNAFNGIHLHNGVTNALLRDNYLQSNGRDGIRITGSATGNEILSNDYSGNAWLPIDLTGDGVTPNDTDDEDADSGSNGLQNYPELASADADTALIEGSFRSKPNTTFTLDFLQTLDCTGGTFNTGVIEKGTQSVTTDANGKATISYTASSGLSAGQYVAATATDPTDGTSEFSKCIEITQDVPTAVSLQAQHAQLSADVLRGYIIGVAFLLTVVAIMIWWRTRCVHCQRPFAKQTLRKEKRGHGIMDTITGTRHEFYQCRYCKHEWDKVVTLD